MKYKKINGIKCFSHNASKSFTNYPNFGHDLIETKNDSNFWDQSRNRLFNSLISQEQQKKKKIDFLEIGCGTGNLIKSLLEFSNLNITGTEIYLKGLFYAKKRIPSADFIQIDISKNILNKKFDFIVCFDVIEHIENDLKAISNISSMLKTKGKFIISVPQYMFLWSELDKLVMHKRRYSKKDLIYKLEQNSFSIKYVTSYVFFLFPLMLFSRWYDNFIGRIFFKKSDSNKGRLEKKLYFNKHLNYLFSCIMKFDEILIKKRFSLPFGGTLIVVAEKK